MRKIQQLWSSVGTCCVVGLLISGSAYAAQQTDEKPQSSQNTTEKTKTEKTQTSERQTRESSKQSRPQQANKAQTEHSIQPQPQLRQQHPVMLGVRIEPSPTSGVYVQDVMPNGPAGQSGIRQRDYILSIDGQKIGSPQEFDNVIRQFKPGDRAEFEIWRNREKQNVTVAFDRQQRVAQRPNYNSFDSQGDSDPSTMRSNNQDAWLGVMLENNSPDAQQGAGQAAEDGVRIVGVYPAGPAACAGIDRGDVITQVGDQQVESPQQFIKLISDHKPTDDVELTVLRGEEKSTHTAKLGNRSDFAAYSMDAPQSDRQDSFGDYSADDISDHAMMLEQHRRFAEQHQRMEQRLDELIQEVRGLKQQLNQKQQTANQNQ